MLIPPPAAPSAAPSPVQAPSAPPAPTPQEVSALTTPAPPGIPGRVPLPAVQDVSQLTPLDMALAGLLDRPNITPSEIKQALQSRNGSGEQRQQQSDAGGQPAPATQQQRQQDAPPAAAAPPSAPTDPQAFVVETIAEATKLVASANPVVRAQGAALLERASKALRDPAEAEAMLREAGIATPKGTGVSPASGSPADALFNLRPNLPQPPQAPDWNARREQLKAEAVAKLQEQYADYDRNENGNPKYRIGANGKPEFIRVLPDPSDARIAPIAQMQADLELMREQQTHEAEVARYNRGLQAFNRFDGVMRSEVAKAVHAAFEAARTEKDGKSGVRRSFFDPVHKMALLLFQRNVGTHQNPAQLAQDCIDAAINHHRNFPGFAAATQRGPAPTSGAQQAAGNPSSGQQQPTATPPASAAPPNGAQHQRAQQRFPASSALPPNATTPMPSAPVPGQQSAVQSNQAPQNDMLALANLASQVGGPNNIAAIRAGISRMNAPAVGTPVPPGTHMP